MHIRNCHTQKTQPPHTAKRKRKREKESIFKKNDHFQNRHHKQLTKLRTRGVIALERSMAKQFTTGGLNQVLGCTNLTHPYRLNEKETVNATEQSIYEYIVTEHSRYEYIADSIFGMHVTGHAAYSIPTPENKFQFVPSQSVDK
jgi:hypothetical protein